MLLFFSKLMAVPNNTGLSILAQKHLMSIKRLVGAQGHGKGYFEGLNVVDKNV